jgi:hypothetical protein
MKAVLDGEMLLALPATEREVEMWRFEMQRVIWSAVSWMFEQGGLCK